MLFRSYAVLDKKQLIVTLGDNTKVTFGKHVAGSDRIWSPSFGTKTIGRGLSEKISQHDCDELRSHQVAWVRRLVQLRVEVLKYLAALSVLWSPHVSEVFLCPIMYFSKLSRMTEVMCYVRTRLFNQEK